MKMKYTYLIPVLLGAVSLWSCSGSDDVANASDELVPVTLQLPGIYNGISSRAEKNSELTNTPIYNLDAGSTLWLFAKTGGTTTVQGYIVRNSSGGVKALYPCGKTTTDSIRIDTTKVSNVPLYLTKRSTYTFSAMSPALPMTAANTFNIKNGQYVVATNNAWTQTEATTLTVNGNEGVVVLNPMMQVGARMTFTIKKGTNISTVSVIQSGVEVDGLGQNTTAAANYSIGDNLEPLIGNSYNRFFVAPSKFSTTSSGENYADCGILPVDCRSTTVYVILNLMVNDVPVQYTYAVKNRYFEAGHSYDYTITLSLKNNITVANWQENSWTYDVDPS